MEGEGNTRTHFTEEILIFVRYVFFNFLYLSNKCTIYINNNCFLNHCYMFRCLHIILRQSLIMYAKVTKLIKI